MSLVGFVNKVRNRVLEYNRFGVRVTKLLVSKRGEEVLIRHMLAHESRDWSAIPLEVLGIPLASFHMMPEKSLWYLLDCKRQAKGGLIAVPE